MTSDKSGGGICRECRGNPPTLTYDAKGRLAPRVCGLCGSGAQPTPASGSTPDPRDGRDSGLYAKYEVTKNGEAVTDCFVLRPGRDAAARVALLAYALATEDLALRGDLQRWIGSIHDAIAPDVYAAAKIAVYEAQAAQAVKRAQDAHREADQADRWVEDAKDLLAKAKEFRDAQ